MIRILPLLCLVLAACEDTADVGTCMDLCEDSQAQNCSYVSGSCSQFCNALVSIDEAAGCEARHVAYEDCLQDEGVCSNQCDAPEDALGDCVTAYCLSRSSDPNCVALAQTF
jgi:hypothetical protein